MLLDGLAFLVTGLALGYLVSRCRRAKNPALRWAGSVILGLAALLGTALGVATLLGVYRLAGPRGTANAPLTVAATPAQLARGQKLAELCVSCHSTSGRLPLDGGRQSMLSAADGSGLGTLYPPNLTPAGPLKDWTDADIARAIRDGVDKDGHALLIMPSSSFHHLSDSDLQAIIAYLRSQPAVPHATPARNIGLVGTLLIGAGLFPTSAQPMVTGPVDSPPAGVTPQYGQYLVAISGCRECHGLDLAGGRPNGGPPPGPNLTLIVPKWTEAQFVQTIRTGRDPNGYSLRPDLMPWQGLSRAYSDDDLKAIYRYLQGLKPIERT